MIGTGTKAGLLVKLWTSWTVLPQSSTNLLDGVWGLYCRIEVLPKKPTLYFCYKVVVCSSVWRERSVYPLTVITPRGLGILSLR